MIGSACNAELILKSLQQYAAVIRVEYCAYIEQYQQNQVSTICTAVNII